MFNVYDVVISHDNRLGMFTNHSGCVIDVNGDMVTVHFEGWTRQDERTLTIHQSELVTDERV